MRTINTVAALRQQIQAWRQAGKRVGFVPTMGNLHDGHLALVTAARKLADHVVVSIFVNPMQFGPNEDFERYPRTLEADSARLESAGVDLLFAPPVEEVYPAGHVVATHVDVPEVSQGLCGAQRPGHFVGVATVVAKLFNMVQADVAIFGEKDYQQLQVIRRMVADLCFPVEIVGVPTVREASGLAMSSRNAYLSAQQRTLAANIYRELNEVAGRIKAGERDYVALQMQATAWLAEQGLEPEYFEVRSARTLLPATAADKELRLLAAARLGDVRLIDNIGLCLRVGAP